MRRSDAMSVGVLALAAMCVLPVGASAFGLSGVGGSLGLVKADGVDNTGVFGGHMEFEEPGSRFHLMPSLLVWSNDGVRDVNPNFDFYYHFNPEGRVSPYLGAGAAVHAYHFNGSDTNSNDLGANMLGGVRFPMSGADLAVESRYAMSDRSQFTVMGRVTFNVK